MKHLLVSLSIAALVSAPALAQDPPKPQPAKEQEKQEEKKPQLLEIGKTLPRAIALPDIDGNQVRSQQFRDRIVVVNFWSITCPIMKGWESRLAAIQEEYGEKGVAFLMINSNEGNGEIGDKEPAEEGDKPYQKIRDHLAAKELPYRVLVDHGSEIADLFQAKTTPDIYVFDKEGTLVYRGLIDDDPRGNKGEKRVEYLRDVLDKLLAGEAVEPMETSPIGCGIKRPSKGNGRRSRG